MKNVASWLLQEIVNNPDRQLATIRQLAPGEGVFRVGDPGDYLAVLLVGTIDIRKGETVISVVEPGSMFGEMGIIDGQPRVANAIAASHSRVAEVREGQCISPTQPVNQNCTSNLNSRMHMETKAAKTLVCAATNSDSPWRFLLPAALVWCLGFGPSAHAADKIVLSTGVLAPYTTPDRKGFLDQIVAATFREVGLAAELQIYPTATERALLNANAGIDDGTALRIGGLEQLYPNLIRVPETLIVNDFVAYSTTLQFATDNWKSIEPYVVSYIIGWKVFEKNVPHAKEITLVRDADQLFGLIGNGRADLALYERWQGLERARALGIKVHALEPPLARTDMFIYLHKKHEALVPRVAQALARLKKNGSYQRIHDATLTPLTR